MPTITLFTAIFSLAVGIAVLWANPRRFANQVFSLGAIVLMAWLVCVWRAMVVGSSITEEGVEVLIFWLRANAIIASFGPWCAWLLKESVTTAAGEKGKMLTRSLPWLIVAGTLVAICYSETFFAPSAEGEKISRGRAYFLYNLFLFPAYLFVAIQTVLQLRKEAGIRRVELQFLVLIVVIVCLVLTMLNVAGRFFQIPALNQTSVLVVFSFYAFAAWVVAVHRVFDAKQILLSLGQRLGVLLTLALAGFFLWRLLGSLISSPLDLVLSIGLSGSATLWLDRKSRDWLDLGGERNLVEIRRAAIELARTEPDIKRLVVKFETLLRDQFSTGCAVLMSDSEPSDLSHPIVFDRQRIGYTALCEMGWATPESLERRRPAKGTDDLHDFLADHSLSLLVAAPRGSRTPSLLVGLGMKTNLWPFTYPEVQRLQNVAELMDNILAHSRVAAAAAGRARMEHLAMMSRGLAHDLKNLITPVSSFLIHTDGRFPPESNEAEVHAAARRSVRIMTDYVREALFFAERLEPKFEPVDLDRILNAVRELTSEHAARREVRVKTISHFTGSLKADGVLLQRMLVNLVDNAIDASDRAQTVVVLASNRPTGWACLQVADEGCGIPTENLGRVFDAYFTTKEFGHDVRGFGLGLTICRKIVDLHHGTISVKSELGRGTTFVVELPADQAP